MVMRVWTMHECVTRWSSRCRWALQIVKESERRAAPMSSLEAR